VISATENIDTEPKHKYVRKLINKAWEKPAKIIKLYRSLQEREWNSNTVIALKACVTLQHYFYHGPIETIEPPQDRELPRTFLRAFHARWEMLCISREVDPTVHSGVDSE
jgi:hypothetical protein